MKIIQSCGSKSWGGLEMQTLKIARTLDAREHDVILFCPSDSILEKEALSLGINVQPVYKSTFVQSIQKIQSFLSSTQVDVIHTHLSHDLWTLVPAMHYLKSPAVLCMTKRMASGVNKKDAFHKYLYHRIDRLYTISNYIKQNVINTCPIHEDKVLLFHNAISLEMYNPYLYDKNEIRESLGLSPNKLIVGIIGRLTPGKGHEEFLKAAELLKQQTDDLLQFLVIGGASYGEEEYESKIKKIAEQNFNDRDIIFTGFKTDIPQMMKIIDILAFPSHEESFGNILLEANAMKLPVVASESGGVLDIIIDGETGILVEPKDAEALARGIKKLVDSPELREQLAENGRKRIEKYFSFKKYIDSLETDYNDLIIEKQLHKLDI